MMSYPNLTLKSGSSWVVGVLVVLCLLWGFGLVFFFWLFVFFLGILKLLFPNPKGIVDKMTLSVVAERYVLYWGGSEALRGKRTC